jgi:hypothetical protein
MDAATPVIKGLRPLAPLDLSQFRQVSFVNNGFVVFVLVAHRIISLVQESSSAGKKT